MFLTYYYYHHHHHHHYHRRRRPRRCCFRDKNSDVDADVVGVIVLSRVVTELRNCGVH
jgi:hypothetical protein